jgi:1-deoxy-D-xylulose-5-phosphate synthase
VRYPRGVGRGVAPEKTFTALPIGKGRIVRHGEKVAILNFGALLGDALQAAEQINATVADMRFVKPLDADLIRQLAATHDRLITLEENAVIGGAGSAVNEFVLNQNLQVRVHNIGLPDRFIDHGDPVRLRQEAGVSVAALLDAARAS